MKTSSILLALASLASANFLVPRADSTSSSAPTTTTFSLSPTASCLASCKAGDVNCEAACVGSAHPNSMQVNQTDVCVSQCPQGNGNTAENAAFGVCVSSCISQFFPTSQTVGPVSVGSGTVTSVSAGATGSGSGSSVSNSGSGTGTAATASSPSNTGSAAPTSSSKAAGMNNVPYVASAGGLLGLFMAFAVL